MGQNLLSDMIGTRLHCAALVRQTGNPEFERAGCCSACCIAKLVLVPNRINDGPHDWLTNH